MRVSLGLLREQIGFFLLVEGRIDDLQAKNPDIDVRALADMDPSSTKKYLVWMVKQSKAGADTEKIGSIVKKFDASSQRLKIKDINAYADVEALKSALGELPEKSRTKEKKVAKETGAEKVYEDDEQVVVRPDTKAATQSYGSGTKWCITQSDESHYEDYTTNNVLFYFILNKTKSRDDPFSKVAVSIQRGLENEILKTDLFDAKDRTLSAENASKHVKDFDKIFAICEADAVKRPMCFYAKLKNGSATSEEIVAVLEGNPDKETRTAIAMNTSTPVKVLSALSKDENALVRRAVARNTSTPIEVLYALSRDNELNVRQYVANNTSTPVEVLYALSKDRDLGIRQAVAVNASAPADVLSVLSRDKDAFVRQYVAMNTSTPVEVLYALSRDEKADVRWCVAANTSTPVEVLYALSRDENTDVRRAVARNTSVPVEVLSAMSKDEVTGVRYTVAANTSAPAEMLSALSKDEDTGVRQAVAVNASAPADVLSVLSRDKDGFVRQYASKNLAKRQQRERLLRSYISLMIETR